MQSARYFFSLPLKTGRCKGILPSPYNDLTKLINKEILHESTFLYEKLNKWGWLDIEFHLRITSQYPCLGDLVDVTGSDFYHLGHHEIQAGFQVHGSNINSGAQKFSANGDDWGLGNENLKFNND